MAENPVVKVVCQGDDEMNVPKEFAEESDIIGELIEDGELGFGDKVKLPLITLDTLKTIVMLTKKIINDKETAKGEVIQIFNSGAENGQQPHPISVILMGAEYMAIQKLKEFLCECIAGELKQMSPEGILSKFNINGLTSEEKTELIRRNPDIDPLNSLKDEVVPA